MTKWFSILHWYIDSGISNKSRYIVENRQMYWLTLFWFVAHGLSSPPLKLSLVLIFIQEYIEKFFFKNSFKNYLVKKAQIGVLPSSDNVVQVCSNHGPLGRMGYNRGMDFTLGHIEKIFRIFSKTVRPENPKFVCRLSKVM